MADNKNCKKIQSGSQNMCVPPGEIGPFNGILLLLRLTYTYFYYFRSFRCIISVNLALQMKSTLLPIKQKSLGSEVLYFGPPIVIYELLSLWLGLPDVCRMDTSFCDQNMRRHFSFQLTAHRISFDGSFSWKSQSFLDWLIAKQVHVRQLFLVSCHTISSKSYQLWSNVVVINLLDCPMLGNSSFYSIISNAPKLTELQITNCPLINDESFSALAAMSYDSLPYLESLCISDCLSITDLGLEAFLLRHGQRLKTLSLNRCGGITGDSLICGLNAARHSLTSFYSKGCVSISQFSLVLKTLEDVISHRTSSDQVVMTDFLLLQREA
jgi:hypothetical protein